MYLLSISTKECAKQNTCRVPCSLVVYIFLVILFSFVILAISNYFYSHCFFRLFLLLSIILPQIIDIVMTSKWFCHHWSKHIGWHGGNLSTHLVGGTLATQIPCELPSLICTNPYNWTFPSCNISFVMDQSTNKTTNEWLLQVAYGKTCATLGALQFAWQQNHSVVCTKSKDRHIVGRSCLFWSSVFAMICPLKNPSSFSHFDGVVLNLCLHS